MGKDRNTSVHRTTDVINTDTVAESALGDLPGC
jgi:hypothetical protein